MKGKVIVYSVVLLSWGFLASTLVFAQQNQTDQSLQRQLQRLQQAAQADQTTTASQQQTAQQKPATTTAQQQARTATTQQKPTTTTATQTQKQQQPAPRTTLREEAFGQMLNNVLPLSPKQIEALHSLFNQTQRAAATYPGVPPRPTTSVQLVNLAPGATPPIARLQAGFVTSMVFIDSTGAPWPIKAVDISDPRAFNVQWDKDGKSNTLLIQAITQYKMANLAVVLKDKDTPIMITLAPGQNAVDYRVDYRIPGLGPNAQPQISGLPGTYNPVLLKVLNGIPPKGSKRVKIVGCGNCRAWKLNGKLFIKTRWAILSPGFISKISSADEMHAYELQATPILLVSRNGKVERFEVTK